MIHTEIHITVLNSHAELFKLTCKKFGIKYTEISFLSDKENHLMTSIRKRFDKLKEIYGEKKVCYCLDMAKPHLDNGRLVMIDHRMKLTRDGIFVSDDIMSDLMIV